MVNGISGYGNQYSAGLNGSSRTDSASGASGGSGINQTSEVNGEKDKNLVGTGSWKTQTIKDLGLEVPGKYFIGVYTDYYRFNPETISKDFPGKSIQTLQDLKAAIEAKKADESKNTVGTGSWSTENIQEAGIDLQKYGEYFIGVYTNFYRFNPDTIKRDFPNKSIQTLQDLKAAIDSLKDSKKADTFNSVLEEMRANVPDSTSTIEEKQLALSYIDRLLACDDITPELKNYWSNKKTIIQNEIQTIQNYEQVGKDSDYKSIEKEYREYTNSVWNKEVSFDNVADRVEYWRSYYNTCLSYIDRLLNCKGITDEQRSEYLAERSHKLFDLNNHKADLNRYNKENGNKTENFRDVINEMRANVPDSTKTLDEKHLALSYINRMLSCDDIPNPEYWENKKISIENEIKNYYNTGDSQTESGASVAFAYDSAGNINHVCIKNADGNNLVDADLDDDAALEEQLEKANNNDLSNAVRSFKSIANAQKSVENLRQSGDSEMADRLQAELDKQREIVSDALAVILNNAQKEQAINDTLNDMTPPLAPDKSDFIDPKTGKLDELAYENAMRKYEHERDEYDKKLNDLNKQLRELKNQTTQARLKLSRIESTVSNINSQAEVLSNLNEQIASTNDPDLKAQLKDNYDALKENFVARQTISNKMDDFYNELMNMKVPTPPSALDFSYIDKNGNRIIDEQAYDNAMKKYEQAKEEYDKKQNELNQKTRIYQRQDLKLEMKARNILQQNQLVAEYSDALSQLKDCIDDATDPEVKAAYQKEYDELKALYEEAKAALDKENEVQMQILDSEAPVPPNKMDFSYVDENGNRVFDELAFDNAMQRYEKDYDAYRQEQNGLYAKANAYRNQGAKIVLQKISVENSVRLTNEFSGALSRLQGQIDSTEDAAKKAELQAKYNELQQTMKEALELSQKADETFIAISSIEVPAPPNKIDFSYTNENGDRVFDEPAYENAMQRYEQDLADYEQKVAAQKAKADSYNEQLNQLLEKAGINFVKGDDLELEAEILKLEAEGQRINQGRMQLSNDSAKLYEQQAEMPMPTPPNKIDFSYIDEDGNRIFDELAYNNAMQRYEDEKKAYDQEQQRMETMSGIYQQQDNKLSMKLHTLDNQREQIMQYQDLLRSVAQKITSDMEPEKAAELKSIYNQMSALVKADIEGMHQYAEVLREMDSLSVPTPPNKIDFSYTNENGDRIFDELAYDNAMSQYDIEKSLYDVSVTQLNAKIKDLSERHSAIYEDIQKLKAQADEIN